MEIGVVVTIALAIFGGLWHMAHSDEARFKRLASDIQAPLGFVGTLGAGIFAGAALAVWGVSANAQAIAGLSIAGSALATYGFCRLLIWLRRKI